MNRSKLCAALRAHMLNFCLRQGSRHVGSEGEKSAADYIEAQFSRMGYAPRRDYYAVTGWELERFELFNLDQGEIVPAATPCFFSPSAEIEGELLWLRAGELGRLEQLGVQGRLCFIESWSEGGDIAGRNQIAEHLDALGAAGAIFISDSLTHGAMAPSSKIQRSPGLRHLGAAAVAQEGALYLAARKQEHYRLHIKSRLFNHQSCNIVASLPGKPGTGKGVFGAHYDTAPLTQGALDNASGTAILLEVAALMAELKTDLELDFAAFSGEEYCLDGIQLGSGDYCKRNQEADLRWFVNFDHAGGKIAMPQLYIGRADKLPKLKPYKIPFAPVNLGGDTRPFDQAGIPTLWYGEEDPFRLFHTEYDRLDTIDYERMADFVEDAMHIVPQLLAGN
ncbi:MAG: M28 family peptidase [Lentisphaerae bacterium]|nr:M28 family peptidase [Lentisphaerota bacterium]